jgi:hypothetical protein
MSRIFAITFSAACAFVGQFAENSPVCHFLYIYYDVLFRKPRTDFCAATVRPTFCVADGILIQTTGTTDDILHLESFTPWTLYIVSCQKIINVSKLYVSDTGSHPPPFYEPKIQPKST